MCRWGFVVESRVVLRGEGAFPDGREGLMVVVVVVVEGFSRRFGIGLREECLGGMRPYPECAC